MYGHARLPRYPQPREGSAIGESYAPPSQTSEIDGFGRFAGSGQAQAGYYQPSYRYYAPSYGYRDYPAYGGYHYRNYGNGHDEIRELQRLFPSTNWPPSMRYYSY